MKFDELGLGSDVLKAVADAGYSEPTPIQAGAIPTVLNGRDVLGIAQTGTGKTASFTLPMIDKLGKGRAKARMPRSLILEPTRELAAQVAENFETYGKYHKLSMALLIGGVSFEQQERKLDRGVDVLIATPGRLLDHCGRGKVLLTGVQILVIDEADRMLDMGFIPDIEEICKKIPFTRQTLFFSATMPPEIQRLADTFLQNPERIEVAKPASTVDTVSQGVVQTSSEPKAKRATLRDVIRGEEVNNAIIFCNRKRDIGTLARSLERHDFNVGALHGDMDQYARMKTLDGFRSGTIKLLVASDVAARGLDIPEVSHVFNYDVPTHADDYVHRIGRTGRAGRTGSAITLVTRAEGKYLDAIEKLTGHKIEVLGTPAGSPAEDSAAPEASGGEPSGERRGRRRGGRKNAARKEADAEKAPVEAKAPRDRSRDRDDQKSAKGNGKRKGGRKQREEKSPVGMGDHVPAFMLREVKLPKKEKPDVAETA